jgi:hypothetical protein
MSKEEKQKGVIAICDQEYDIFTVLKICEPTDLLKALTQLGEERVIELRKKNEKTWFTGFSINYSYDNIKGGGLNFSDVHMKFNHQVNGKSELFTEYFTLQDTILFKPIQE